MKIFGIAGHSGMGKTTLLERLVPEIAGRGLVVSLIKHMQHCDLVLIEGFKHGNFPKLEVWRASVGTQTLWPDWPGIMAIASDTPPRSAVQQSVTPGLTQLDLADTAAIAAFVLAHAVVRSDPVNPGNT